MAVENNPNLHKPWAAACMTYKVTEIEAGCTALCSRDLNTHQASSYLIGF